MRFVPVLCSLAVLSSCVFFPYGGAFANDPLEQSEQSAASQQSGNVALTPDFEHFYDDITFGKLARLYWKLGVLDINDDDAVDKFMMITECDIYKEYSFNEFEWKNIRNKARVFLKDNLDSFPVRFKYAQPLKLFEYNFESGFFEIMPEYQIRGSRKFEVIPDDYGQRVCNEGASTPEISKYPKALFVELTQPLNLTGIPMKPAQAKKYIDDKMIDMSSLPPESQSRKLIYDARDAYIVMKIRVFTYKGEEGVEDMRRRAVVYTMLEGFEIYSDAQHENLLYFENYVRRADEKTVDVKLKEQYEALRRKRGGGENAPDAADDEGAVDVNAVQSGDAGLGGGIPVSPEPQEEAPAGYSLVPEKPEPPAVQ